jgi:hypothetical protein
MKRFLVTCGDVDQIVEADLPEEAVSLAVEMERQEREDRGDAPPRLSIGARVLEVAGDELYCFEVRKQNHAATVEAHPRLRQCARDRLTEQLIIAK